MDPDAAVDRLQDLVQDAEIQLDHAQKTASKAHAKSLHMDARDTLDEAGEVHTGLREWLARGGFKPRGRRYETWTRRYADAEKEWSRQGKLLR